MMNEVQFLSRIIILFIIIEKINDKKDIDTISFA